MIAVGTFPLTQLVIADHLNKQPDGTVTVSDPPTKDDPGGPVWSWQPGGYWQKRPSGTAGGYEKALVVNNGTALLFNSVDPQGVTWPAVFAYFEKVPNS